MQEKQYSQTLPAPHFDLEKSVSCAQAFRWKKEGEAFFGIAEDKAVWVYQENDAICLTMNTDERDFWRHYFSLDCDYGELEAILAQEEKTAACLPYSQGIRIFRQEPFETLISFIISANNHYGRICSLVNKISHAYGKKASILGREYYAFPKPDQLALATKEELETLGCGYRAAYIAASAQKVAKGYDLNALRSWPYEQAMRELQTFAGVGPKVAACIALFSLGFEEAFPVDVWMKRVLQHLYPNDKPQAAMEKVMEKYGRWAGAAQQYFFHYARAIGLGKTSSTRTRKGKQI